MTKKSLELAEKEFEQARAWLITVEKGFLLKEEQLRKAQNEYAKASARLAELKRNE